ncbi:T9SS type A sorting domain-containing protein [Psychroserpens sp.]|uniref:T9SS type A sorting domain-containing protein n=1 Tax=Psychroserpens sp. TaxID=2020870 RepID=UPI0039E6366D
MTTILLKNLKKTFVGTLLLILSTTSLFAASSANDADDSDFRMKMSLMFNSASTYERELFLVADESATLGFDPNFDTAIDNIQSEDMYWLINSGKYIDQGLNSINEETIIPIGIHTDTNGFNTISIHKLENIPNSMSIFVYDNLLGEYHNIKEGSYEVYLEAGVYLSRFQIVFAQPETLSTSDFHTADNQLDIRFDYVTKDIEIVNNSSVNIQNVNVYSILGQSIYKFDRMQTNNKININTNSIRTGTYIVLVQTENGIVSKKILVN